MSIDILENKKIVLIEDNDFLSNVIVKKLQLAKAEVLHYKNGLEGLAAIREYKPDLVLLDILLPVMNGYEVLEVMSTEGLTDDHPVLVVSNSGQPVELSRVVDLGAKDYLVKADFTPEEVLEKARLILSQVSVETEKADIDASTTDPIKVFVVEDDPLLRNMLSVKFSKHHLASMFTNDGSEAINLATQFEPDVLVLDLMVPGKDGFEILEECKKMPEFADTPVIIFSNKSETKDKQRVLDLGATSYRVKATTDLNDLITEIRRLTNRL